MILYEVNLTISNNSSKLFLEWLPGHVRRVLKSKGFMDASIFQEEKEALQITVFYKVKSKEDLESYFNGYAKEMRQEGLDKFPNQSRLLLKKIFFKKKFEKEYGTMNIPTLGNILMRSVMASSAHKVKEVAKMSHIFLNPPIEKYGMMDFGAFDELVELGYKYTMNELEKYDLSKLV